MAVCIVIVLACSKYEYLATHVEFRILRLTRTELNLEMLLKMDYFATLQLVCSIFSNISNFPFIIMTQTLNINSRSHLNTVHNDNIWIDRQDRQLPEH